MRKFHPSRMTTVCLLIPVILTMLANDHIERISAEEKSVQEPLIVKVILQRIYLDGEVSEEVTNESVFSVEDFWTAYEEWQLIDQNEDRMIFRKNVDDISPLLKANGYFGITDDGTLSIFNGKPETNDIIQSFFQIDIKKLESHKQDELLDGIRIESKDQYLEVLKTYEPYSKVIKK